MALIKCSECGKDISDRAEMCPHCGIKITPKEEKQIFKYKNTNSKKIIGLGATILVVIVVTLSFVLLGGNEIESDAKKYIRQTKKIDNVEEISAVGCIRSVTDDGEERNGYIVFYIDDDENSEIAYFLNGEYRGDGHNGGDAKNKDDEPFYNMGALNAGIKVLEFIDEEGLDKHTSYEEHFEIEEGLIYLKLYDMLTWIENK